MTEYDYSPEGYERYLETQRRISQWVDTAEAHRDQFKAPFGVRSDMESERWDDNVRGGRGRDDDYRRPRLPSGHSSRSVVPPPPSMIAASNHTWYPTHTVHYPPAQSFVVTAPSKRKSGKSHKSSSKSKRHTYIIPPPIPPSPTVVQPPPGQYGPPSVTYITTDHTGYPVTRTSPLHQIPGSIYSYSTPPPPMTSPPGPGSPPMMSPYTTPAGSPLLHQPGNVVIIPQGKRKVRIMVCHPRLHYLHVIRSDLCALQY
ncbi:hypothetical protein L218DRAFT_185777 [Marasmius fiardii PR-910]|nr:hypothetical protein L218DRAFT_185777 [Marasmius fiardii PR-910]